MRHFTRVIQVNIHIETVRISFILVCHTLIRHKAPESLNPSRIPRPASVLLFSHICFWLKLSLLLIATETGKVERTSVCNSFHFLRFTGDYNNTNSSWFTILKIGFFFSLSSFVLQLVEAGHGHLKIHPTYVIRRKWDLNWWDANDDNHWMWAEGAGVENIKYIIWAI